MEELQGAEETERRAKERAIREAAAEAAAEKRKATQARVERMKEWDEEEIRMLEKALEKFPQVCDHMHRSFGIRYMSTCHCSLALAVKLSCVDSFRRYASVTVDPPWPTSSSPQCAQLIL